MGNEKLEMPKNKPNIYEKDLLLDHFAELENCAMNIFPRKILKTLEHFPAKMTLKIGLRFEA